LSLRNSQKVSKVLTWKRILLDTVYTLFVQGSLGVVQEGKNHMNLFQNPSESNPLGMANTWFVLLSFGNIQRDICDNILYSDTNPC